MAEKQCRFSPEESQMITEEFDKLRERDVIRPSTSPWAAQVLGVRKKDGTLRLYVGWRKLKSLLVLDSWGQGDTPTICTTLKEKIYFTQLDLPSGFHHLPIAEAGGYKTTSCDGQGRLFEFTMAGFGLTASSAAFIRMVTRDPGNPTPTY